jgi:hypothetical protein
MPLAVARKPPENTHKTGSSSGFSGSQVRVLGHRASGFGWVAHKGHGLTRNSYWDCRTWRIGPPKGSGHTGSPEFIGFGSRVAGPSSWVRRVSCPRHHRSRSTGSIGRKSSRRCSLGSGLAGSLSPDLWLPLSLCLISSLSLSLPHPWISLSLSLSLTLNLSDLSRLPLCLSGRRGKKKERRSERKKEEK